ncbi:MAG: hypothetical protein GY943_20360 [Chloroflexi bacterium]|nr:hypothetical protein [Chloroflexota bacterium]
MQRKFQYIMTGAGITLLVLIGAFAFLLTQAKADTIPTEMVALNPPSEAAVQTSNQYKVVADNPNLEQSQTEENTDFLEIDNTVSDGSVDKETTDWLGTKDNPVTDMNIIIQVVSEFAQRQEERLLGKVGWLHVASRLNIPHEMKGNGYHVTSTDEVISMDVLVPEDPIFETWYYVNEMGLYSRGMGLVSSPNGTIHQQTVLVDGQWSNLTLRAADAPQEEYESPSAVGEPIFPISMMLKALEEQQTWSNTTMQAYLENGQYIVIVAQQHDPPIEDAVFVEEPVLGSREVFTLDMKARRLVSREAQILLQSGTWLRTEREEYLLLEFTIELPANASQLFDTAIDTLEEEE